MKTKIAAVILFLAGLLHLVRVIAGWSLTVENYVVPVWVSLLAVVVTVGVGVWLVKR